MAFELHIAVKRDPADELGGSATLPDDEIADAAPRKHTLSFDVNGDFSQAGGAALARAVDDALTSPHSTYFIRLENLSDVDPDALLTFVQWARGRRDEGTDVLVSAVQSHVHHAIAATGEADTLLIPFEHRKIDAPRLVIDVSDHSPA